MKITIKKFITLIFVLAFLVSTNFCLGCFFKGLPKGTFVNGIDVSLMDKSQAIVAVRQDILADVSQKQLKICVDDNVYSYAYPHISFIDNVQEVVDGIKKRGYYTADYTLRLNGIDEVIESICNDNQITVREPYGSFKRQGSPFEYFDGVVGKDIDKIALKEDILSSLESNDLPTVIVNTYEVTPMRKMEEIKGDTSLLYTFSTAFDSSNEARSHNIKLSSDAVNGYILNAGEVFSFNGVVGERSEERGYKQAKVIFNNEFTLGVGGGVCQVSTTLYNGAILSGMEIIECHQHSLQVGYVPPSRDAMVSWGYFDLVFKNPYLTPIYIRMNVKSGILECSFYGQKTHKKYSMESEVIGYTPKPEDIIVESEEEIKEGKDGVISKGYLVVREGENVTKTLVREDSYAPIQGYKLKQKQPES